MVSQYYPLSSLQYKCKCMRDLKLFNKVQLAVIRKTVPIINNSTAKNKLSNIQSTQYFKQFSGVSPLATIIRCKEQMTIHTVN